LYVDAPIDLDNRTAGAAERTSHSEENAVDSDCYIFFAGYSVGSRSPRGAGRRRTEPVALSVLDSAGATGPDFGLWIVADPLHSDSVRAACRLQGRLR